MAEQLATKVAVETDFRPIYAWPPLETEEWRAVKEALPDIVPADINRIETYGIPSPEEEQRSTLLIPCSVLPELGEDGPQILQWEDDLAEILGRRQLRYGKQKRPQGHLPGYFLGFSGKLSLPERQICYDNKLYQREGEHDCLPSQTKVNNDGSQTLEYRDYIAKSGEFRLEQLHGLVMRTIAPRLGRIMASNVEVQLTPGLERPSLFAEEHRA